MPRCRGARGFASASRDIPARKRLDIRPSPCEARPVESSRLRSRRASARTGSAESMKRWLYSRSEEHTSELQSHSDLVCRLLLEKKKKKKKKKKNTTQNKCSQR